MNRNIYAITPSADKAYTPGQDMRGLRSRSRICKWAIESQLCPLEKWENLTSECHKHKIQCIRKAENETDKNTCQKSCCSEEIQPNFLSDYPASWYLDITGHLLFLLNPGMTEFLIPFTNDKWIGFHQERNSIYHTDSSIWIQLFP